MTKNEIIHNYMNERLLNGVYPEESITKMWSKNGDCVFMYVDLQNTLYVRQNVWDELYNMFSLDVDQTNGLFRGWVIRNLGLSRNTIVTKGMFIGT